MLQNPHHRYYACDESEDEMEDIEQVEQLEKDPENSVSSLSKVGKDSVPGSTKIVTPTSLPVCQSYIDLY